MLVSLTVGKVDAGVAVLLTEDKRLVSQTSTFGFALTCQEQVLTGLQCSTDRIPVDSPSARHPIWQRSRHKCGAQPGRRIRRRPALLGPPG